MSKKLKEAWITICRYNNEFIHDICGEYVENPLEEEIDIVNNTLQRLEAIDNAKPSEALKELELVENWIRDRELKISNVIEPSLNTIKQSLLKAQEQEIDIIHYKGTVDNLRRDNAILKDIKNEQEKVLEIIRKKEVNMQIFNQCEDVETYNNVYKKQKDRQLTQEEFDLLKRWANGKANYRFNS